LRLVDRYGEDAFVAAAKRAQGYRRFSSSGVERILERAHPLPEPDPIPPLGGVGAAILGEVDPGSLEIYGALDHRAPDAQVKPSPEAETEETGHGS
jgi:hypothetical protein